VVKAEVGDELWAAQNFEKAASLLLSITIADELVDFLTLPAYELLQ
jgi:malate synthase